MNVTRLTIVIFILIGIISCTKKTLNGPPLNYSYLPEKLELDSVRSFIKISDEPRLEMPDHPDADSYRQFKSVPVRLNQLMLPDSIKQQIGSGILFSPYRSAMYTYYREKSRALEAYMEYYKAVSETNLERFKNAKYLLDIYYDKAEAAEVLYQSEIVELKKEAKRSWFEKNLPYVGFAAGIALTLLTEFAVISVAKE